MKRNMKKISTNKQLPDKAEFNGGEVLLYQTEDGTSKVEVRLQDGTVWLTQEQLADLFQKSKSTINEHIKNIFKERELNEEDVMRKFGNSEFSTKPTNFYNLDVIISVGYRVRSHRGTQFRQWATERLKEYIIKGFTSPPRTSRYGQFLQYLECNNTRQG